MATKTRTTFETRNDLPDEVRDHMVELLNARLADTADLYGQLKQAHWNVKGSDFIQLHLLYDTIAESVLPFVDEIAERATALGGLALGTVRMAAKSSSLDEYPLDATDGTATLEVVADRLAAYGAVGARRDRRVGRGGRHGHLGSLHRDLAHDRQAPLVRRGASAGLRARTRLCNDLLQGDLRRLAKARHRRSVPFGAWLQPGTRVYAATGNPTSSVSSARKASDSRSSRRPPPAASSSSAKICRACGVQADSPSRQSPASHVRSSS